MAQTTPIKESIALDIVAAVNTITVANGYNQDLTAVRPTRIDFSDITPGDGKVLIVQSIEEEVEGMIGCKTWLQTFVLEAIVIDSDTETDSIDIRRNKVEADIRKKLRIDPKRSSNAMDTIMAGSVPFAGEKFSGVAVVVEVMYRTDVDDPYTKA